MKKKYILKPGRHQFAPGSPAVHTNANVSDKELEWYIIQYPHIVALIERSGAEVNQEPESERAAAEPISEANNE
jgi:hypothetical protein